jgi:ferric-dicitrate binding protein FerR (iron transport regulator)
VFDNTPLRELVLIIHDQYGVDVKLAEDSIGDKTISGIMQNDSLDNLLQALEGTGDFDVVKKDKDIIIKGHQQEN